jgi:hypothetical protein
MPDIEIAALSLPKHVVTGLHRAGYRTLMQLKQIDERKLRAIPGIGKQGLEAIRTLLEKK